MRYDNSEALPHETWLQIILQGSLHGDQSITRKEYEQTMYTLPAYPPNGFHLDKINKLSDYI